MAACMRGALLAVSVLALVGALARSSVAGPGKPCICLADAVVAAQRLYPHAKTIIEKAKVAFGERWDDADLGPVIWSSCQPDSSDAFLHELNHKDRDGNCIHVPDAKPLCFTDLSAFPARKIALLKAVETDDAHALQSWESVNRSYFVDSGDMGALLLFDEVVAYSITTDVDTAMVAAHFKAIPAANLPFIAMMAAHYLELVRASDPKAFAAYAGWKPRARRARTRRRRALPKRRCGSATSTPSAPCSRHSRSTMATCCAGSG